MRSKQILQLLYTKILILFFCSLFFSINCFSAIGPTFKWAKRYGNVFGNEIVTSSCNDLQGNLYITGYFSSDSLNFNNLSLKNSSNPKTSTDAFVAAFDSLGNLLWAKSFGGYSNETSTFITVNPYGLFVGGSFSSDSIRFGTNKITNSGYQDIFIVKFSLLGVEQWAKCIGGNSSDILTGISSDVNGNIYFTGVFSSPTILMGTTTLSNSGGNDILVAKFNKNGSLIWVKSAGGSSQDYSRTICNDQNGNVFVSGGFNSSNISFGTIPLSCVGGSDIFIAKIDFSGNWVWANKYGGISDDYIVSSTIDNIGNLYVTGNYTSPTLNISTGTLSNSGSHDIFVAKLNSAGSVKWVKNAGGTMNDIVTGITIDPTNAKVYIVGYFNSTILNFGSSNYSVLNIGNNDSFFAILFAGTDLINGGDCLFAKSVGGLLYEGFTGISSDLKGNVFFVGSSNSPQVKFDKYTLGFNRNLNQEGDLFIASIFKFSNDISSIQTICKGSVPLEITGSGYNYINSSYKWIQSADSIYSYTTAPGVNSSKNYQPSVLNQSTYYKRIAMAGGYSDTSNWVKINVGGPVAKFLVNNNSQCLNSNLFQFNDSSFNIGSSFINNYYWSFGDGTNSTLKNPNKKYNTSGVFNVKLIVINDNLCKDSIVQTVTVSQNQSSKIYLNNTFQCVKFPIHFFDSTKINFGTIINRAWDFGDGSKSNQINPIKAYNSVGIYNVKLITTNNNGCKDTAKIIVNVLDKPVNGSIIGSTNNTQTNILYPYFVSQQLGNYNWLIDNGLIVSGQGTNAINVKWPTIGQGTLKCILINNASCSDTSKLIINISVGMNENYKTSIKIFPNPTDDKISIEGLNKNEVSHVYIYDFQGIVVLSFDVISNALLDLSSLKNGIYLIRIGDFTQKVIKK
jgi:PKD repeat protein